LTGVEAAMKPIPSADHHAAEWVLIGAIAA
jgi:hypothetical protein